MERIDKHPSSLGAGAFPYCLPLIGVIHAFARRRVGVAVAFRQRIGGGEKHAPSVPGERAGLVEVGRPRRGAVGDRPGDRRRPDRPFGARIAGDADQAAARSVEQKDLGVGQSRVLVGVVVPGQLFLRHEEQLRTVGADPRSSRRGG